MTSTIVAIIVTDMEATNNTAKYTATIMGDDDLITVDLRTLDADKLTALRSDAAEHDDTDMVGTIDELLGQ